MIMASRAQAAYQATPRWPHAATTKAADSGPSAEPVLPPTWNSDWARPWRPPEAMRATRLDSGWKTDEPSPISTAATSTMPKLGATETSTNPTRVDTMAMGSE